MPKNPGGYYDPKTGILHQSNGATVAGDNSTGVSGEAIIQEAEKYVGKLPYVWGGSSLETGADCSGFVWAILKKLGLIDWERTTDVGIRTKGTKVASLEEAQAGDVICYAGHVAFYDGHGGIVHEADETQGCKHGNNAAFTDIITIRRFANGNSSGTATTENSSSDSATNSGTFKVKVATWQENSEKIVSTDSSENMNQNNYSMSEITIPYQAIVAQYRMPFNYLWTMLVYSNNDKDYVFDLANLVRNSQIEITIHDNLQDTTTTTVVSHTEKYHYEGEADVKFNYTNTILAETPQTQPPLAQAQPSVTTSQESTTQHGTATEDTSSKYRKTTTTRNKTNTLDIALTLADTWCVKFEKEYEYDGSLKDNSSSSSTYEDQVDEEQYNQISRSSLLNKVINNAQNNAIKTFVEQRKTASINSKEVIKSSQKTTQTITDRKTSTETNTTTKKYTAKPEKYNLDDTPKFAIVFNRHYNARSNILSAKAWFFEALESNADTVNMVDLTKYLMYKATGTNYGVTTYNFSVYNPSSFTEIGGGTLEGNTTEERVWLALINAGFNDVAAAAAMGNLSYESGGSGAKTINTDIVEGGYTETNGGIGMCQWTNNNRGTEGRNTQLRKYAQSQGKTWKDEAIQIEFLITEITGQGKAKGYASYQFMTKSYGGVTYSGDAVKNVENDQSKIDYATRAFAATFERPAESAFSSSMSKRVELANYFYNQFKGKTSTGLANSGNLPFNLEHAIKVFDGIHARENGHLKWQGEKVDDRGGTLGCYEEAVNIFNGTNYRIYEIYNILVKNHPELRTTGKEPYKCEDMNRLFNMSVSRAKADISEVKNALQQGKLVQLMVHSNKWRNSEGKWVSWPGTHSGLIFYYDGVYFHMKAAGKIEQSNAIYTETQLIEWMGHTGNRLVIYTKIK